MLLAMAPPLLDEGAGARTGGALVMVLNEMGVTVGNAVVVDAKPGVCGTGELPWIKVNCAGVGSRGCIS